MIRARKRGYYTKHETYATVWFYNSLKRNEYNRSDEASSSFCQTPGDFYFHKILSTDITQVMSPRTPHTLGALGYGEASTISVH